MNNHLPGVTPIMVGQGGARPELQVAQQAITLPSANEIHNVAAAVPVAAPVAQATVVAPALPVVSNEPITSAPVTATSSMNVSVRLVTKAVIEMPWGFIKDTFNYAFLTPLGELCISTLPPLVTVTGDVEHWTLMDGAEMLLLGNYSDVTHWRDSLTMRPDTEEELEDLTESVTAEEVAEAQPIIEEVAPIVEEAVKVQNSISKAIYDAMSKTQQRKHRKAMRSQGLNWDGTAL